MLSHLKSREFLVVFALAFIVFFAQTRDFQLLFDGLTYFSISKNILRTGDWAVLHYSPEQYWQFYQHPPLAMWLQAFFIRLFGDSESISRILPSSLAVGTVISGFLYFARYHSLRTAFWFGVILTTSIRYLKWGSNFYLDGILGFFIWVSTLIWLVWLREPRRTVLPWMSGLFMAAAFMTKGAVALAGMAGIGMVGLFFASGIPLFVRIRALTALTLGIVAFLGVWWFAAGGWDFTKNYISLSLLSRIQTSPSGEGWIHPWRNLYSLWIPWWPVALGTLFWSGKSNDTVLRREVWGMALIGLLFPIGFSFGSIYLEHYLTPFYPFGAFVAAFGMVRLTETSHPIFVRGFQILTLVAGLALATVAPGVHPPKDTPIIKLLAEIKTLPVDLQNRIKTIAFTESAGDLWAGIATIQGKTRMFALGNFDLKRVPPPESLLFVKAGEQPNSAWQAVPCLWVEGYRIYLSEQVPSPCSR